MVVWLALVYGVNDDVTGISDVIVVFGAEVAL